MEKNIKDYLHLYLGCEVEYDGILNGKELKEEREANKHDVFYTPQIQERKGIKVGLLKEVRYNKGGFAVCYVGNKSKKGYWGSASGLKLILRPLSDMTEEEAIELIKIRKWKQYGGHPHTREYKTYRNSFKQLVVSWGDGLREKNVPETKEVFEPEEFRYLLSKHFDLFGLIESGLAIDKTKLEK